MKLFQKRRSKRTGGTQYNLLCSMLCVSCAQMTRSWAVPAAVMALIVAVCLGMHRFVFIEATITAKCSIKSVPGNDTSYSNPGSEERSRQAPREDESTPRKQALPRGWLGEISLGRLSSRFFGTSRLRMDIGYMYHTIAIYIIHRGLYAFTASLNYCV